MISLNGQNELLDQQLTYLSGLEWGLFTTNLTLDQTTPDATITGAEATWAGYARQEITSWPTPTTVGGLAQTAATGLLTFTNTSASTVTFYGWFAWDAAVSHWIAALNIGETFIPAGASFAFAPVVTDANSGP